MLSSKKTRYGSCDRSMRDPAAERRSRFTVQREADAAHRDPRRAERGQTRGSRSVTDRVPGRVSYSSADSMSKIPRVVFCTLEQSAGEMEPRVRRFDGLRGGGGARGGARAGTLRSWTRGPREHKGLLGMKLD